MTEQALSLKEIEARLTAGPRNVVDLVDQLLTTFQKQAMYLEWKDGQCRFHCLPEESSDSQAVPLPRSVFRAILARLAVLCNEHMPDSVSPYGGEGEFHSASQHFRIVFSNNNQQGCNLEISPLERPSNSPRSEEAFLPRGD